MGSEMCIRDRWYDASTGQPINGATLDTYNPGILVEGSYGYYVEISFNDNPDNGCDLATSQTVSFEVVADPVLTDLLATQTVCLGSPVTALEVEASGGAGTTYSYQWYDASTDQPIGGETLDTFTPPTSVVGTFNYYVIVTTDASGCETQSTLSLIHI